MQKYNPVKMKMKKDEEYKKAKLVLKAEYNMKQGM